MEHFYEYLFCTRCRYPEVPGVLRTARGCLLTEALNWQSSHVHSAREAGPGHGVTGRAPGQLCLYLCRCCVFGQRQGKRDAPSLRWARGRDASDRQAKARGREAGVTSVAQGCDEFLRRGACENTSFSGGVQAPLSSCRGPQAALNLSHSSDSVTRAWPVALRVRAAQTRDAKRAGRPGRGLAGNTRRVLEY